MGLRAIFQPRERSEIMALPYASADLRTKNELREQRRMEGSPPKVYETPQRWMLCVTWVLVLYYLSFVNIIAHI